MNDNQGAVSRSRGSSEGQAGRETQVCIWLYFTSLTSQKSSAGREGGLGRSVLSENLAEPFPRVLQLQLCWKPRVQLSVMQLLCARPCREQLLGEGWPGSWRGQAAWLLGRALGWESRDPGLRSGFFTGWWFGQVTSPLCSRLLYFTDFLTGLLEGLHGRMYRRVLWKYMLYRFLLFWYLVPALMWSFSSGRLLSLFLYNSSTKIQLDDSWGWFQLLDTRALAVPCTGLADAGNTGQPSLGFGSAPAAP